MNILFVCRANLNRSPTAEAILRERKREEVSAGSWMIASAGTGAWPGRPLPAETREVLRENGIPEPPDFLSKRIRVMLGLPWDHILVMEAQQVAEVRALGCAERTVTTLDPRGADVEDPVGGTPEDYRRCFRTIDSLLRVWQTTRWST